MKADKLYPLADYGSVPGFRRIKGFRNWPPTNMPVDGEPRQYIAAKATGERRPPKVGEWYLSGAIVEAHEVKYDFDLPFHIAKIVIVTARPVLQIDSVKDAEGVVADVRNKG